MTLLPLAVVESWQSAVNARDLDQLAALSAHDVEMVGPRGAGRGHEMLLHWAARAGFSADALRWFCGRGGMVVVEQLGRWYLPDALGASERILASAFTVRAGRVVRFQRFDALQDALTAAALTDDDEVIHRS
ncbi:MAG: nuclear transport factor 2 family protein [Deltaproteobacteria bacterium]|nr:nuclear transport factor 2 family protein [Deltaproteobacteria bacterium]